MQNNKLSIITEEHCQEPAMETHSIPAFLVILTFACEALLACAKQLDIMSEESGNGDYGTKLAHSANAIKIAIKEDRILATKLSTAFTQLSNIVEKVADDTQNRIYSLFFDAIAKNFLKFRNDEQITANMWLNALTYANKMISEVSGASVGNRTLLDALIPAEHKLRDALDSGLNPVNAFGEAVAAAETSAMQTVHMSNPQYANSGKIFRYPDPGAHAVGIWMRAAYEGVKLKFGHEYNM